MASAEQIDRMAAALMEAAERGALAHEIREGSEAPDATPETWDDVDEDDKATLRAYFAETIEAGVIAPGPALADPMPTTADTPVVVGTATPAAASMLRAAHMRAEEMRTAVIAARALIGVLASDQPLMGGLTKAELEQRWLERFGRLADPPLEIEVEDDDDPADTPMEGTYWQKESSE